MRMALNAKNKIGLVDGSCKREHQNEIFQSQWDRRTAVVLSWLINLISKEIVGSITFSENAKEVWNDLCERFDVIDGTNIYSLHHFINALSQGGMSVFKLFYKVERTMGRILHNRSTAIL